LYDSFNFWANLIQKIILKSYAWFSHASVSERISHVWWLLGYLLAIYICIAVFWLDCMIPILIYIFWVVLQFRYLNWEIDGGTKRMAAKIKCEKRKTWTLGSFEKK
jgi:fatty acid desaturase